MNHYIDDSLSVKENMKNIRGTIGNNLKEYRKNNGDRQLDIASLLGCNQPYVSHIEHGTSEIKASMIPILADRYNVYAENFFNKDGVLSDCLIAEIINHVAINADNNEVRDYLRKIVQKIIEDGKSEDFFKMFYVSAKTCFYYDKPMEHIASEMYKSMEYDVIKDIEDKIKGVE